MRSIFCFMTHQNNLNHPLKSWAVLISVKHYVQMKFIFFILTTRQCDLLNDSVASIHGVELGPTWQTEHCLSQQ